MRLAHGVYIPTKNGAFLRKRPKTGQKTAPNTADGKVVASLTGGAYTSIPLAPGFDIVQAGDKVAKVAIP